MPAHDWTRVLAGTFHDFHLRWIAELSRSLNTGLLPETFYAMAEQPAGHVTADYVPDVLTLESVDPEGADAFAPDGEGDDGGGTAVALAPPRTRLVEKLDDPDFIASRARTLSIRHASNDRVVALLEIVSPGNKDRAASVEKFVRKATDATDAGLHLVVIDLFPPKPSDPKGLCAAVWAGIGGKAIEWPAGQPLAGISVRREPPLMTDCYGEAFAVGDELPPLPLFYAPGFYVELPLEATYASAYEGVAKRWKRVLEGGESA